MDGSSGDVEYTTSLVELADQITELAGHLNAANYRWLTLIAEFDKRNGWSDGKLHSCAHWLNFKCGLNLGAAREKVRVAHALEGLPKIAEAMSRGHLSYSKARALTRVATCATEDNFLMIALHGTAHHVETLVRHYRRAEQRAELSREVLQHNNRSLHYWFDEDGSLVLKGRLPALAGAAFVKALDVAAETPEGSTESWAARRADALGVVAESFLQQGTSSPTTADRFQVVVHVDAETLRDDQPGRCAIDDGPSLPAETVRRLACDASLVRVVENESGDILDVGRKTRTIPPAIRRALKFRDTGCRFPGCTHQRFVDAHHVEHWAHGGKTCVENLVTLCRSHHRMVHEGGIVVRTQSNGDFSFLRPDGREYDSPDTEPTRFYHWNYLSTMHADEGLDVDSTTAVTRWQGERMDYDLAIFGLVQSAERSKDVAAETRRV